MSTFDALIENTLNECGSMLRGIATDYHASYEDLRQDIALLMLEQRHMLPDNRNQLRCYLRTCAKRLLFNQSSSCTHVQIHYLDEPLSEDGDTPLAETLVAPDQGGDQDTTEQDRKIAALHAALRRLPLDEQRYVREVYNLNAYQPVCYDYKTREKDRNRGTISAALYKHLRHDTQLKAEVLS